MLDRLARPLKDRAIAPLARAAAPLPPNVITGLSFLTGLAAAGAAFRGAFTTALAAWLLSRVLDGLDGAVARLRGTASDLGGYLDIVADFVIYAALPLGIGAGLAGRAIDAWPAAAFLLASFYVNAVSWLYLAALLEKRGASGLGPDSPGARGAATPAVVMPEGLIGGTETVLFFCAFLLWPARAPTLFAVMGVLVLATAAQRVVGAPARLR